MSEVVRGMAFFLNVNPCSRARVSLSLQGSIKKCIALSDKIFSDKSAARTYALGQNASAL